VRPQDDLAAQPAKAPLAVRLIRQAARCAPPALAGRLEEEWLADLAAQPSPTARLRFALGCCWATCVIAHEHGVATASVATSHTGAKTMSLHSPSILPRRSTVILLVLCLHIGIIYLLSTGLATRVIRLLPSSTEYFVLQETHPTPTPPPPPVVQMAHPKPDVPVVPELDIQVASDIATPITISPTVCQGATCGDPPRPAPPPVVRVPGGVGKGFPNTDDYYPSSAIRQGQEGITAVKVCVDEKGQLSSEPALARSSGITAIDGAALRLARAGSGHYLPSTENGRPVSSCYAFNVHFRLRN
jgi:protein TonB